MPGCGVSLLGSVPGHRPPTHTADQKETCPFQGSKLKPHPTWVRMGRTQGAEAPNLCQEGRGLPESDLSHSGVSTELHGRRDSADGAVLDAWWVPGTRVGPLSSLKRELRVRGGGAMGAGVRGMRARARERRHLWTLGTAKPRVHSEPLEGAQEVPPRGPAPGPAEGPRRQVSPGPPSHSDTAPGPAILSSGLRAAAPANKVAVVPT